MIGRMKRIRWKRVFLGITWLGCLTGLVFLMSFISVKSNDLACSDLQIIIPGEQSFMAREDIDKFLYEKNGSIVGKTLTSLTIHDIEQDLKSIPFIENALVSIDMNGTVTINIKQREAVLRVINARGEDFYIDTHGLKIPLSPRYAPNVLVANGFIPERFDRNLDSIQTPLLKDLFKASIFIQQDSIWNDQIEQLYVNINREIEMVPRVGKHQIILGNADSLKLKFDKLLLFYKHVAPKVGWDVYKAVNLSYANQLVCTKDDTITNNNIN